MADIEINRTHSLGLDRARTVVERVAGKLREKINVSTEWSGNTLQFEGSGADGRIEVSESEVRLAIKLNFLLKSMKGWIRDEAEAYLDEYLQEEEQST